MYLYCVFFSFTLVNVLAETIDDYQAKAVITNELIREACEISEELAYMIAVPEYADTEGLNIFQCMKHERDMQEAIIEGIKSLDEKNIDVPKIEAAKILDPSIRNPNLKDIGYSRRLMTKIHIKHLLSRVERRQEECFGADQICHLIGIYKNSKIPRYAYGKLPFIKTAKIDSDGICILTSSEGIVTYYEHNMFDIFEFRPDLLKKEGLLK